MNSSSSRGNLVRVVGVGVVVVVNVVEVELEELEEELEESDILQKKKTEDLSTQEKTCPGWGRVGAGSGEGKG